MINWKNLPFLPDRRFNGAKHREHLALISYKKKCAKHKGRCHLSNQKRRQIALEKEKIHKLERSKSNANHRQYVEAVRAYWSGLSDVHP